MTEPNDHERRRIAHELARRILATLTAHIIWHTLSTWLGL